MPVLMVSYEVAEDGVEEVVAAVRAAFAAVPEGVRWEYYRRGAEFVALLELPEGGSNPLLDVPAARELQATVAKWVIGAAPVPQPLEQLGARS